METKFSSSTNKNTTTQKHHILREKPSDTKGKTTGQLPKIFTMKIEITTSLC